MFWRVELLQDKLSIMDGNDATINQKALLEPAPVTAITHGV